MNLNNKNLFYLGYLITYIGSYFSKVEFANNYEHDTLVQAKNQYHILVEKLKKEQPEYIELIKTVDQILTGAGPFVVQPPRLPIDYHPWLETIFNDIKKVITPQTAADVCFSYGFYLGKVRSSLEILKLTCEFNIELKDYYNYQQQYYLIQQDLLNNYKELSTISQMLSMLSNGPDYFNRVVWPYMEKLIKGLAVGELNLVNIDPLGQPVKIIETELARYQKCIENILLNI